MEIDPSLNLVRIRASVIQCCVNLGEGNCSVFRKFRGWIVDRSEVVNPHGDLPDIGPPDNARTAPGRALTEGDQRVLITARAFVGVATQPIRQTFAGRAGAQSQPFSQAIIKADRDIYRHDYSVARCQRSRYRYGVSSTFTTSPDLAATAR